MKNRIIATLSALALMAAGFVGITASAAPASAAQNTRVCYSGSISYAPSIRVGSGAYYTLTPGTCRTHSTGIRYICAAGRTLVINNSVFLTAGRCYETVLNSTYNIRPV